MDDLMHKPNGLERHFRRSESIAAIAGALAKAQGELEPAIKDSANPFFKSKYADLASIFKSIRAPFSKYELAVVQFPRSTPEGVEVETMLAHSSGEWMAETLSLPVSKYDSQGVGSAISYARRYALQSIAGVPADDDDGEAAVAGPRKLREMCLKALNAAKSLEDLEEAWKSLTVEGRKACAGDLPSLKAKFGANHAVA